MLHAAPPERFLARISLPSGQTVVVAEGDYEARSLGSYSVRLYAAAPSGEETTFFTAGLVQAREGTLERVDLADLDGDAHPEVVVVVRSVGSGGYLSAQAFAYDVERLWCVAGVADLPADADPLAALRSRY